MRKRLIILSGVVVLGLAGAYFFVVGNDAPEVNTTVITNFEECAAAGNPVMESYPRRCRAGEQMFIEDVGNELEKTDLIRLDSPRPNGIIESPLVITGMARGYWFFEATFPVTLVDWDGRIIAEHYAEAQPDPTTGEINWMTDDFVPFKATLEFESPVFPGVDEAHFSRRGELILRKDNPSDLPEYDDALEFTVWFK